MTSVTAQPGPPVNSVPAQPAYAAADGVNGLPSPEAETRPDARVPRGPVTATMNFYREPEDGSPPHNFVEKPTDGTPQRNFGDTDVKITIQDLRGKESQFDLDRHAFSVQQGVTAHDDKIDWDDDASVKKNYYPQVEEVLMRATHNEPYKIVLFDHTVRRADPNASRAPVNRCHIDQTPFSAKQRVGWHLPADEADAVLAAGTRYRIINVWRPINGIVESQPLGFANSQSVPDADMVSVEHRYPNRTGETAAVRHNPDHEWYYWSGMRDDERLMLQCFDSHNPGNRVPHSAFVDPRSAEDAKPRESIEVRALVFG